MTTDVLDKEGYNGLRHRRGHKEDGWLMVGKKTE